jgi:transposase
MNPFKKSPGNSKENELLNGITFVNGQIQQYDSLIYTLEQQKKEFIRNRERMEKELSDLRESIKKTPFRK